MTQLDLTVASKNGTNWNAQLSGHEVEPLELLEEVNACKAR